MRSKSRARTLEGNAGRPSIERMGLFSEIGYLEASLPPKIKKEKELGKQFTTSPPRENTYFTQNFQRAFEGESYSDLVLLRRHLRLLNSKKYLEPAGFRPSNVPQKSSGKGSNYGTISHQYPLKESQHEESEPEKLLENEEKELSKHLRNFYTSPPKIGGYGYVEGCIGKPYEYISSPYNREQELNAHARLMSKKKNVTVTPFIGSSHETPCFDPNPFKGLTPFIIAPKPKVDLPSITWKPNAGCSSFLNPFPEYKPPYPQPSKVELQSQIREKLQLRKTQTMTDLKFKPVGATCHSYPIKSLIQMNIPKSPSAHVRSMIKTLKQSK